MNYFTGSLNYTVAVGDFNGDGKADLASATSQARTSIGNWRWHLRDRLCSTHLAPALG